MMLSASIGIIGGADGPTSILVSTSPAPVWWIIGAVALAAAVIFLLKRKK